MVQELCFWLMIEEDRKAGPCSLKEGPRLEAKLEQGIYIPEPMTGWSSYGLVKSVLEEGQWKFRMGMKLILIARLTATTGAITRTIRQSWSELWSNFNWRGNFWQLRSCGEEAGWDKEILKIESSFWPKRGMISMFREVKCEPSVITLQSSCCLTQRRLNIFVHHRFALHLLDEVVSARGEPPNEI